MMLVASQVRLETTKWAIPYENLFSPYAHEAALVCSLIIKQDRD